MVDVLKNLTVATKLVKVLFLETIADHKMLDGSLIGVPLMGMLSAIPEPTTIAEVFVRLGVELPEKNGIINNNIIYIFLIRGLVININ